MPLFEVHVRADVIAFGVLEVTAETPAEAIRKVQDDIDRDLRQSAAWTHAGLKPDWDTASNAQVVGAEEMNVPASSRRPVFTEADI